MIEPILHHYANSPFSEKIRLIFGLKRMAWRSVFIPSIMPKPDVLALTGGYRKTPFLQIGADIYCDTALMARVIDGLQLEPPLYPESIALAAQFAQWADSTLFWCAVAWAMQPAGIGAIMGSLATPDGLKAFAADRAAFGAGIRRMTLPDAAAQLRAHLAALDQQLRQGGPYLFGPQICIADFSAAHCLWFIQLAKPVAHVLDAHPALCSWLARMQAIGHDRHTAMSSTQAIEAARDATEHAAVQVQAGLGFEAGERVTVAALDYGTDAVAGELVGLNLNEVVVRRVDERAGTVQVHFPRIGFQIRKDQAA